MRTSKRILPTFSDNVLRFRLPKGWSELSQEQLRQLYGWMALCPSEEVKVRALSVWGGFRVTGREGDAYVCHTVSDAGRMRFTVSTMWMAAFTEQLAYLDNPPLMPVRLENINGYEAVNPLLHGMSFGDYLQLENYHQGYLSAGDSLRTEPLCRAACLLYTDAQGNKPASMPLSPAEALSVFYWMVSVKNRFAAQFPHFFRPAGGSVGQEAQIEVMNAQIRALTGGDVTKERQVLELDVWRALTELDAKAREAQEIKRKLKEKQ